MKKLLGTDLTGSYTFNPAANTITFSGLRQNIALQNILLITNTTANTIIYNFADSNTGAVSFNNNILTLDYNTSAMSSTDKLQIYVDVESYEESLNDLLRRMNKLLESNTTVDVYQRQKVVIEAVGNLRGTPTEVTGTIPVSGTVTASLNGIGSLGNTTSPNSATNPYSITTSGTYVFTSDAPVHQLWRVANDAQACYAQAIRSKLTFS